MQYIRIYLLGLLISFLLISTKVFAQNQSSDISREDIILQGLHSISSNKLYDYIKILTSEKFGGRLTGTKGYQAAADWVAKHFTELGIKPLGDNNTYFQCFDNPYTLVYKGCEVSLEIPYEENIIRKIYRYEDEFVPGATSGSGEVKAEVVYAGYGISAPDLNYDDYQGIDVNGKIVLLEREVPVSSGKDPDIFKKWRPYSFHQYKLKNAVKHGAKGMLYNYGPISNPNNTYNENFIYSHIGKVIVSDIFAGTKKSHDKIVEKIKKELKPQSFATGKIVSIKNFTEHHPEGKGCNVIGLIEGNDPELKKEVIIIGAHLDHLGYCYEMMPGANDNASGVAALLETAKALAAKSMGLKRSVMFICFGAEEQGVVGSKFYLDNPKFPLEKTLCLFNMDGVGCGDSLVAVAAKNFPQIWKFIETANKKYIHRYIKPTYFSNLARPRLDAARFMWAGVPTISYFVYGAKSYYHISKDDIKIITPEIIEDLAQLLYLNILEISDQNMINFRE